MTTRKVENLLIDANKVVFSPTGLIASTDVQAALAEVDAEKALIGHVHTKRGRLKASGGTVSYGMPGVQLNSLQTTVLAINQLRYFPFYVDDGTDVLDQVSFEVTAAPASNANVLIGVSAMDSDCQPTGTPLIEVTQAVASGFTGMKDVAISSGGSLPVGPYIGVINCDVTMTVRSFVGNAGFFGGVDPAMGASAFFNGLLRTSTYGTLGGTTIPKWTTTAAGATPLRYPCLFRWTPP